MLIQYCITVNNRLQQKWSPDKIKKGLNRNCARSKIQYPMKNLQRFLQITVQLFLAVKQMIFGQ
jgi:hypothetical protein